MPVVVPDSNGAVRVAEVSEQATRDYIHKRLRHTLTGGSLAEFVADLLGAMGYSTFIEPGTRGTARGITANRRDGEPGFGPAHLTASVASRRSQVGQAAASAFFARVEDGAGLLATLGSFTPPVREFARDRPNLYLLDGEDPAALT